MISFFRELTLDELLGDPMTQAVMQADRVEPSALRAMLRSVAVEIDVVARRADDSSPSTQAPSGRWSRSLAGWRNAMAGRDGIGSGIRSQLCEGC